MSDESSAEVPLFGTGVFAGVVLTVSVLFGLHVHPDTNSGSPMSYSDLAATMLAAVAIIVTVLGVFVAILALWGYSQFKRSASKAASKHVANQLQDGAALRLEIERVIISEVARQMEEGGRLREMMTELVDRNLITGPQRRVAEEENLPIGNEETEYGEE